jgi:hypothetical protein
MRTARVVRHLMFKFSILFSSTCSRFVESNHSLITCRRGSAKHSVKDDHAFLWKHAIFRHLPSRNPSTDQDEVLHD